MASTDSIKLCECGCGKPTLPASITSTARGWVKGRPLRFIHGHSGRRETAPIRTRVVDTGYTSVCLVPATRADGDGYVRIRRGGKRYQAHRYVWKANGRPLADDEHLHHLCGERRCVNPDHLCPVSNVENQRLRSRLSAEQVVEIRRSDETLAVLAKRYGISSTYVSQIKTGKRKRRG